MHFPTSLPPNSGSPAAKLVFERRSSPHPETFDGPPPPPPSPGFVRTKLPLLSRSVTSRFVRLPGPGPPPVGHPPPIPPRPAVWRSTVEYRPPEFSLPGPLANSEAMPTSLATAKLKMKGGLSSERLIKARNSWKRKRRARLDGARKPDAAETIENLDGPFRTEFENARDDAERSTSLMSVNSKQKLKKIFTMGQEGDSQETGEFELGNNQSIFLTGPQEPAPSRQIDRDRWSETRDNSHFAEKTRRRMTLVGPRERLMAARASRDEDRADFGEKSNPENSDSSVGSGKHKISRQTERLSLSKLKERHDSRHDRKSSEKDAYLFQAQTLPDKNQGEYRRFAESAKRKMHMAKEELQAYRSSIADDVRDAKETNGIRIFNAVRTAKARFEMREAEKQAGIGRLSSAEQSSERSRHFSTSPRGPIFSSPLYSGGSSSPSPPLNTTNPPFAKNNSPPSPTRISRPHNMPSVSSPRNQAYQQVFPTRPTISYRPTLSPVYSKSPVPTSSSTQPLSTSPRPPPPGDTGSVPLDFSDKLEVGDRDIVSKQSFLPTSMSKKDRVSQSVNETINTNLTKGQSYEHPRRSLVPMDDIPPLKLPSPEVKPINPKEKLSHKFSSTKSPSLRIKEASTPQNADISSPTTEQPSAIGKLSHPNIEFSKTPTSSTLEFWAAADASLAPSESASAQPANRIGEPPPDIWRDADRTLNLRKGKPSLEEWIAGLPGLHPRKGPRATGSALDAQMLKELRTQVVKKSTSKYGKDSAITALAKKLKVLEDETLELDEELIPEDELGLTAEEVKKLEVEIVPENSLPLVIDPSLLHPEYHPTLSPSIILDAISPMQVSAEEGMRTSTKNRSQSLPQIFTGGTHMSKNSPSLRDLTGGASTRLDALKKYWDEQGIIVGTVLRRMLWIVDTMIVKEREEAQRLIRKKEMGWMDDDGDDEAIDEQEQEDENE